MKRLLISLLFCACALCSSAQVALTLDSCLALAERNQLALKKARLDVHTAELNKDIALSKYFPTLTANAGYFHSLHPIIDLSSQASDAEVEVHASYNNLSIDGSTLEQAIRDEFGEIIDNVQVDVTIKALNHGAFAGLLLTQPIFVGGRIINGNRLAQLGVDVAEVQLAMTRDEVLLNAESMYLQVVSLKAKMDAMLEAVDMIETLREDATAAHEAGLVSRNDLLKVNLKRNELLAQHAQLSNGINLATKALLQYIGLPDTSQILLADLPTSPELPDLNVRSSRQELALLDAAVRAEELKLSMIIGQGVPQIALSATYGMSNLFGQEFKRNGAALVSVSLPITGRWENYREFQKQELALEHARLQRDDMAQKLALQNEQITNTMLEAETLMRIKAQAVSDAEENLAEQRTRYQAGLCPMSELLEAQTLHQQAQSDFIDQHIAYRLALARYKQVYSL